MNQNYIVDKLTLSDLTKSGKIVIPSFQRGIVWNKEHRKDFIETVKSGDPFGVVLVSQAKPSDPYILIDGLQRLSTLKAYMTNPLEFVDENDKFIDVAKLQQLIEAKYQAKGLQPPKIEKQEKEKKSFLKKMISFMKGRETTPKTTEIWPAMAEVLEITKDNFGVYSVFDAFYSSFLENLELPDIIIHAIVYQGPQERLPMVFEHLNTTSVTLSKYEVFSSQWPSTKIVMNDEEIVQSVWGKYSGLKNSSSFDVDTTEDSIRNGGITLFEYCFAFSEILNDEKKTFSYMFSKTKKSTDPTGFDLLALACGLPVNRAEQICKDEYLGSVYDSSLFINLKNAILESINLVNDCIKEYVTDLKGTPIKNTSIYQMYHMIISVFNHLFKLDLENKTLQRRDETDSAEWIALFRKYAYKWYLLHRVNDFWNENRQTSDLRRLLDEKGSATYVSNISRDTWIEALNKYIEKKKSTATSRTIDNETKLVLNYLYKLLIREDKNRADYFAKEDSNGNEIIFDIEHIAPVDKFKKFDEDLPISSLGNLCYLPVKDNRSKRDKTIYAYAEDRPSLTFKQEFLDLINYPSREELEFLDYAFDEFKTNFEKMIKAREASLIKRFTDLIMKY